MTGGVCTGVHLYEPAEMVTSRSLPAGQSCAGEQAQQPAGLGSRPTDTRHPHDASARRPETSHQYQTSQKEGARRLVSIWIDLSGCCRRFGGGIHASLTSAVDGFNRSTTYRRRMCRLHCRKWPL